MTTATVRLCLTFFLLLTLVTLSAFTNDFLFFFVDVFDVLSIAVLSVLQRQQQRINPGIDISAPQVCEQRERISPVSSAWIGKSSSSSQQLGAFAAAASPKRTLVESNATTTARTHAPLVEVLPRLSTRLLHLSPSSACRPASIGLHRRPTVTLDHQQDQERRHSSSLAAHRRRLYLWIASSPPDDTERSPSSRAAENASFALRARRIHARERGFNQ